ncbi:hypothetical protein JOC25_001367 [Solibacillus kalamii]|nr:hypothetical protein [Solibacillus kalamii]
MRKVEYRACEAEQSIEKVEPCDGKVESSSIKGNGNQ